MKLLELYSNITGLKIGKQFLLEKFYPLTSSKYITIQSGSGMIGKNYPYYSEVIKLIYPILQANKIDIVQLGGPEDSPLLNCINLNGKTDIHQTNYILSRAIMHLGNDSWMQHRAGHLNIPVVDVFGATSSENHSPYQYNPRSIFLSAHRNGKNPTFAIKENPQTISTIKPELIAESILKILGANIKIPVNSLFMGSLYHQQVIEWVPDFFLDPNFVNGQTIAVRCDYTNDENYEKFLAESLKTRQLYIITDKEIDINILKEYKKNVSLLMYKITDSASIEYIKLLKSNGLNIKIISEEPDDKKLSELRFKYFEVCTIEKIKFKTKDDFVSESEKYLNYPIDKNVSINQDKSYYLKSNKFILSQGKIYPSKWSFKNQKNIDSFENNVLSLVDDDLIWEELDNIYIFQYNQI